jgi:hypothetical protein
VILGFIVQVVGFAGVILSVLGSACVPC